MEPQHPIRHHGIRCQVMIPPTIPRAWYRIPRHGHGSTQGIAPAISAALDDCEPCVQSSAATIAADHAGWDATAYLMIVTCDLAWRINPANVTSPDQRGIPATVGGIWDTIRHYPDILTAHLNAMTRTALVDSIAWSVGLIAADMESPEPQYAHWLMHQHSV